MVEEADKEIGRLLYQRGLGDYDKNGNFILGDLEEANTIIAWMGDNGTFYTSARLPFNPLLSKATVYQTGVWVPLAVAGVGVTQGEVDHPVNAVDVFAMFADVAGVSLEKTVPESHAIDAVSIAPYLTHPNLPSLREFNYAQSGSGVFNPFDMPQAGIIMLGSSGICDDVHFNAAGICESNGGTWYGVDSSDAALTGWSTSPCVTPTPATASGTHTPVWYTVAFESNGLKGRPCGSVESAVVAHPGNNRVCFF